MARLEDVRKRREEEKKKREEKEEKRELTLTYQFSLPFIKRLRPRPFDVHVDVGYIFVIYNLNVLCIFGAHIVQAI